MTLEVLEEELKELEEEAIARKDSLRANKIKAVIAKKKKMNKILTVNRDEDNTIKEIELNVVLRYLGPMPNSLHKMILYHFDTGKPYEISLSKMENDVEITKYRKEYNCQDL